MSTSIFDINRKYNVNAEYFSDINTQEKAYWLGFIWADGSIGKTAPRCSGPNRFTLTQVETEANHLQAFVQAIECSYTPVLKDFDRPLGKRTLALDVNSRPFCMALENLGYGTKEHRTDIPALYDYMYDGATVYMKSKHQKFEKFFQREHEAQNS